MPPLTKREREILSLVAKGYGNKEIGHKLSIESATVRTHLDHVFKKLRVRRRTAAVVKYFFSKKAFGRTNLKQSSSF